MKNVYRTGIISLLVLLMIMPLACAHNLHIETDTSPGMPVNTPHEIDAKILFGHPDDPESFYLTDMRSINIYTPDGSFYTLDPEARDNYWLVQIVMEKPGDYILVAERQPSVYNPKSHGGPDSPRLTVEHAKTVINAGTQENWHLKPDIEFDVVPLVNPYNLRSGDTFKAQLLYRGEPIEGTYMASPADQDIHSQSQAGKTDENGIFSVTIDKSGMWQIQGNFAVEESGTWEATFTHHAGSFNESDLLDYDRTAYRTTMTLWANPSHDSRVSELEYQLNEVQDANSKLQEDVNQISSNLEAGIQNSSSSQPLAYAGVGIALVALLFSGWLMVSLKKK